MEIYNKIKDISVAKCSQNLFKQFISAFLAGNFLAFGACCSFRVGGEITFDLGINRLVSGIFGIPIGLILIVLTNTQIFNANITFSLPLKQTTHHQSQLSHKQSYLPL